MFRGAEDRRVDARGERDAQRIVRRHADDPRVRPDELIEIRRVTADDVGGWESPQKGGFENADTRRHIARRPIVVVFDVPPSRILFIEDPFQPDRQRRHAHLDEVPRVIDDLGKGRGQHDSTPLASRGARSVCC